MTKKPEGKVKSIESIYFPIYRSEVFFLLILWKIDIDLEIDLLFGGCRFFRLLCVPQSITIIYVRCRKLLEPLKKIQRIQKNQ